MSDTSLDILLKNNQMIKAKYEFTELQNKILQKTFLDVQKNKRRYAEISIEDIKEITKNTGMYNIKAIDIMLKNILDNDITQIRENGNWIRTKVISSYEFIKKQNIFEIELSQKFLSLVLEYKNEGFTAIDVTKYSNLSGVNSQRLYELLRMWTGSKGVITYKVIEIREYLNLNNKYSCFPDFKKRVIESAIKDINKKGLMNIHKVEYVKIGRSIESIKFYVKDLEPRNYTFEKNFKKEKVDSDGNAPLDSQIEIDDYKIDVKSDNELLADKAKLSVKTIDKLIKDNGIEK
ncbi:MAG: replication initiation protein, partial [Sarcina sp.]